MNRKELSALEKNALFDKDFKTIATMLEFKDKKHEYNTKQQLKSYDDSKIIKQMFNLILDQREQLIEDDRLIKVKDMKIRQLRDNKDDKDDKDE